MIAKDFGGFLEPGIWSDASWVFSDAGLNIAGSTKDGGYPFFPEDYERLKQDVALFRQHLEKQLTALAEAEKVLSNIKVIPEDIAATLRAKTPLTDEQSRRLRKLHK